MDFKVKCTAQHDSGYFTTGKIYSVVGGTITGDYETALSGKYKSVKELNEEFEADFELVTDPNLPRICYILGGEDNPLTIGEHFALDYDCVKNEFIYFIDSKGNVCVDNNSRYLGDDTLCDIINHPEKIIRRPQFSKDEKALMRLYVDIGFKWFARDQTNEIVGYPRRPHKGDEAFEPEGNDKYSIIPENFLPQITWDNSPFNVAAYLESEDK